MQGLIDSGKYKVIEVLESDDSYEACLCIDVMVDSGYRSCLINTYKSREAIKTLLPLFYNDRFQECSSFRKLITSDGCVSVVFDHNEGESFQEYFVKNPSLTFQQRQELAQSLLLESLQLDLLDDRLAQRVTSRRNVVVDKGLMRVGINYMMPVEVQFREHFRSVWLGELHCTIFPQGKKLPLEIDEYIIRLLNGEFDSCVDIYSEWREVSRMATETLGSYEKEGFFKCLFRYMKEKKRRNREIMR